jgi:hypothetical protein
LIDAARSEEARMPNDDEAVSSQGQLPDVAGRNLRDLMDDSDPGLRAAIEDLVKLVKRSPGLQLGWSSRIEDAVPPMPTEQQSPFDGD